MWQKQLSYHLTVLREGINSLQLSLPCPTNTWTQCVLFGRMPCKQIEENLLSLNDFKRRFLGCQSKMGSGSRVHRKLHLVGAKKIKNFDELIHLVLPNVEFANQLLDVFNS